MKMIMKKQITQIRQIDQDVDIETNIQNVACLDKTMPLCNKQYLNNKKGI